MRLLSRPALAVFAAALLRVPAALAQTAATAPQNLPLQPGDRVVIKIWADTTLADSLVVADDGSVMLPRLGPLPLAGVPAPAIGDSIRKAYATLLRPVSIEVVPLRRVSVIGEVRLPAVLYLDTHSTVRDAVAHAGGIDDIGHENPIILLRDSVQVKLDNWRLRSDPTAVIHSGDVVIVERDSWIKRNIFSVISGVGIVASLLITIYHK